MHHKRRRLKKRSYIPLGSVIAILFIAFGVGEFSQQSFKSVEVKFADASPSGLSIMPASCPSQPHFAGECDPPATQSASCTGGSANLTWSGPSAGYFFLTVDDSSNVHVFNGQVLGNSYAGSGYSNGAYSWYVSNCDPTTRWCSAAASGSFSCSGSTGPGSPGGPPVGLPVGCSWAPWLPWCPAVPPPPSNLSGHCDGNFSWSGTFDSTGYYWLSVFNKTTGKSIINNNIGGNPSESLGPLPVGSYSWSVKQCNGAGQCSAATSANFMCNAAGLNVSSLQAQCNAAGRGSFEWNGSENPAGYYLFTIDGVTSNIGGDPPAPYIVNGLGMGSHNWSVQECANGTCGTIQSATVMCTNAPVCVPVASRCSTDKKSIENVDASGNVCSSALCPWAGQNLGCIQQGRGSAACLSANTPDVTIMATPNIVRSGNQTTISWDTVPAGPPAGFEGFTCDIQGNGDHWIDVNPSSHVSSPIMETVTYNMSCKGLITGTVKTASVTVRMIPTFNEH